MNDRMEEETARDARRSRGACVADLSAADLSAADLSAGARPDGAECHDSADARSDAGACSRANSGIPAARRRIDDIDAARAEEYTLLAVLLARAPDAPLLRRIAALRSDDTVIGRAHAALAQAADCADVGTIEREYFELFIGIGRGELLPYGSYYLTGFLNERPLARLRGDLRALGIERAPEQTEPEDHAATVCEIMAGLCDGPFAAAADVQEQFFARHVAPWLGRFFTDLEHAGMADFYARVGAVGRVFVALEAEFLALPA
jgi:TorA maturation chaperone TorD